MFHVNRFKTYSVNTGAIQASGFIYYTTLQGCNIFETEMSMKIVPDLILS